MQSPLVGRYVRFWRHCGLWRIRKPHAIILSERFLRFIGSSVVGSSGIFVATAVCFGQACCVLVLERSFAGTIIQVLRNVNLIPLGNSHHPITSTAKLSTKKPSFQPQQHLKNRSS